MKRLLECSMCGKKRKRLYLVNIDKDYQEFWCKGCIEEDDKIVKKFKSNIQMWTFAMGRKTY